LIQAALGLFAAKGYDGTSVRAIARAVGLSESVLYAHFDNKRAVFEAVLTEFGPQSALAVLEDLDPGQAATDPPGFIRALLLRIVDEWSTPQSRLHISLMAQDGLIHEPALTAGIEMAVRRLAELFEQWIADGQVDAGLGSPLELAYALMSPVALARVLWLHGDSELADIAAARTRSLAHVELFIRAIFGAPAAPRTAPVHGAK
jgi:AcrR family transcriptional regulator